MLAHHHAAASDAQLRLVIQPGAVFRVLGLLGLDRLLLVYPSLDAALIGCLAA